MKNLYIVRHAKAMGQEVEAPLTQEGKNQAFELIDFFQNIPIQRIVSSPYKRTIDTITPLAKKRNMNIEVEDRLAERVLSTQNFIDWKERLQHSFENFEMLYPGGESNAQGLNRVEALLNDISHYEEEHIILVSHGNLTTLLLHYFDASFGYEKLMLLSNPDVYWVQFCLKGEHRIKRIWER